MLRKFNKIFEHEIFISIIEFLKSILSPTYLLAKIWKKDKTGQNRAEVIKFLNTFYFLISIVMVVLIYLDNSFFNTGILNNSFLITLVFYLVISRMNEIFFAFIRDAKDKMEYKNIGTSGLEYYERVILAFKSYIELIIDYGILYWILFYKFNFFILIKGKEKLFNSIFDAIYYSGSTITTLGFGDIHPSHFVSKVFSVYEVINGMLLVVVCFTVYVALNYFIKDKENNKDDEDDKEEKINNKNKLNDNKLAFIVILIIFIFLMNIFSMGDIKSISASDSAISSINSANESNILNLISFIDKKNTLNWFFSSSAQSLATFVGLLIAGYSIFINAMDNKVEEDESYFGIYHDYKKEMFFKVKSLALVSVVSIIGNISMITLNGTNLKYQFIVFLAVITFTIIAFIQGIRLTLLVINPDTIENIARKQFEEEYSHEDENINEGVFMREFIKFEKIINFLFEDKFNLIKYIDKKRKYVSLRKKIDLLQKHEKVNFSQFQFSYGQIIELIIYRNRVAHGRVDKVSEGMYNDLHRLVENLREKYDEELKNNE